MMDRPKSIPYILKILKMATKKQIEVFQKLVKQWFDKPRAKALAMKLEGGDDLLTKKAQAQITPTKAPSFIDNLVPASKWEQNRFLAPFTQENIDIKEDKLDNNIFTKLWDIAKKRSSNIAENQKTRLAAETNPDLNLLQKTAISAREGIQSLANIVGWVVEGGWTIVLWAAWEAIDAITPDAVDKFASKKWQQLLESDIVQTGLKALVKWTESYGNFAEKHPEVDQSIKALFDLWSASGANQLKSKILKQVSEADLKKSKDLQESAESKVAEFLSPTKDKTTRSAMKITPEILERDIKGTREEVLSLAKEQRKEYGKLIEDFEEIWLSGKVNMDEVDDVIDKFTRRANLIDSENNIIYWQEAKVKALDDIMQTLRNVSKWESQVDSDKFTTIRKAFDEVYTWTDVTLDKFQNKLKKKIADELRRQFARDNVNMADINKEFSFYANLDDILSETVWRRFGKWEGWGLLTARGEKITSAATSVWVAVGFWLWDSLGAVLGALVGRQTWFAIEKLISSPKWKLSRAQDQKKLADAIAAGDGQKMRTAINSIIVSMQVDPIDFKYEETEDWDTFIEQSGWFQNAINSLRTD